MSRVSPTTELCLGLRTNAPARCIVEDGRIEAVVLRGDGSHPVTGEREVWVVDFRAQDSGDLPEHLISILARWAYHGHSPGSTLECLLANDLMGFIGRADDQDKIWVSALARFLHQRMPSESHGSREKVQAWAQGGARAYREKHGAAGYDELVLLQAGSAS